MKQIILSFLCIVVFAISCKTSSPQAEFPAFWAENNIPAFTDGMITSDKNTGGEVKSDYVVVLETGQSFDEIYKWHKEKFAADGWKVIKNVQKGRDEGSEIIILSHTKGNMKHNVLVLETFENKRQIKTTLTYFSE